MDPITAAMAGLTAVLALYAIGLSVWWMLLGLYDIVRALIGIRLLMSREDRTLGTVERMRVRGQA